MRRLAIMGAGVLLAATLCALPGCAAETQDAASSDARAQAAVDTEAMAGVTGTPSLQPADHAGRAQYAASRCYGCHGAGSKANPQLKDATVMPEDHYVDGTYDSQRIVPERKQCITCHPVA